MAALVLAVFSTLTFWTAEGRAQPPAYVPFDDTSQDVFVATTAIGYGVLTAGALSLEVVNIVELSQGHPLHPAISAGQLALGTIHLVIGVGGIVGGVNADQDGAGWVAGGVLHAALGAVLIGEAIWSLVAWPASDAPQVSLLPTDDGISLGVRGAF